MSGSDPISPTPTDGSLVDLPLRAEATDGFALPSTGGRDGPLLWRAASLSARATAGAADAAAVLCTTAAALLLAARTAGRSPEWHALGWSAAFALYLSLFATVVPLVLFGKTLGMAVAGLSARPSREGRRLTLRESLTRWLGTLLTGATLGLAVLWAAIQPDGQTLADRLSGRPLVEDGNEEL